MPNWCEGTLKVRGTKKNLKSFVLKSIAKLVTSTGNSDSIPRLDVQIAAKLLGMNHNTVRKGLQQGVFPWGYAVHISENRWSYSINAARFAEIEGIKMERLGA